MSFREKIDNILKYNKLHINSVYALEAFVKASPGSISKYLNKGEEPGLGTIKKIREGLPGLNQHWWDTGKGDIFVSNVTYEEKAGDNTKNLDHSIDEVLQHLMEGNSQYILINKELILEKYRLVSVEKMEEEKRESERKHQEILKDLEDRKNQIHGLYKLISEITSKIPDPGSNKVPELNKTH